jgi:pimeloyl-ACP methyl ester carboxylesterase
LELSHHRGGSGETLVLIHGVGSSWRVWRPLLGALERERDVIAIDLPGHGSSAALPVGGAPGAAALADAVASFLDGLGVERPVVGGNSLGGWVGLELAKRDRARAVVALSPAGFFGPFGAWWCRAHLAATTRLIRRWPEQLEWTTRSARRRKLAFSAIIGHPELVPRADALEIQRGAIAATAFFSTLATLTRERFTHAERVGVPVSILWGTRDLVLFPRQVRRALRELPRARHVPLPGAGHVPTWDAPEAILRELLAV